MAQAPTRILRMVTGEQKLPVVTQQPCHLVDRPRLQKAPAVMPFLRPRIVEQQENPIERCGLQGGKQVSRIIVVNANIVERLGLNVRKQGCDTINIRLATDQADMRMGHRFVCNMLAGAETDLQPHGLDVVTEQRRWAKTTWSLRQRNAYSRQQVRDQRRARWPQSVAAPATIELGPAL